MAQKATMRMPEEECSQMALRKWKQGCGTMPMPPSHHGIYSTLSGALVYPETSSSHDLVLQDAAIYSNNTTIINQEKSFTGQEKSLKTEKIHLL